MEERQLFAEICVNDTKAIENDMGTIEYFEQEMGWVSDSGIYLRNCKITDSDDVDPFARYIGYVLNWAMDCNDSPKEDGPLTYEAFLAKQKREIPCSSVYTGMNDQNNTPIFLGDNLWYDDGKRIITGEVVFVAGAFGIASTRAIDHDFQSTCNCDNFISFWELYWNSDIVESNALPNTKVVSSWNETLGKE